MSAGALALLLCPAISSAEDDAPTWVDSFEFSGDFRLRWEGIELEGVGDRRRGRFRSRFGFSADVQDDVKFVLRLATGDGNPVSTNQTFGDGFSLKDIAVDRAYVDWQANEQTRIFGGKMKSPWFRSGGNNLMWDSDLNPEGIAATYAQGAFFGNLGWMIVDESSGDNDVFLYTGQAGMKFGLRGDDQLTAGVGYFHYTDVAGSETFFFPIGLGNTVDSEGNYVFDYSILELFAEYKTRIGGFPLTFFGQYAQNNEVDDEDKAFAVGANLGSARQQGQYSFSYAYHDSDADAVIASFSDSDFANGFTNSFGHLVKAKYALRDKIILGGTLILSKYRGLTGEPLDFDRVMLDIEFFFG